jgi:hypothetical protein
MKAHEGIGGEAPLLTWPLDVGEGFVMGTT